MDGGGITGECLTKSRANDDDQLDTICMDLVGMAREGSKDGALTHSLSSQFIREPAKEELAN